MARKVMLAILIPMLVYSLLSCCIYIYDKLTIKHHEKIESAVANTDLSGVFIGGYKLGQTFESHTGDNIGITTDDGEYYSSYTDGSDIKNKDRKIIRIDAYSDSTYPPVLEYNDEPMQSCDDFIKTLGTNYAEGVPYSDNTDTMVFIDRANDIKLVVLDFDEGKLIYLQRIDDKTNQTAAPILESIRDPLYVCFALIYLLGSHSYVNLVDYYTLPIYFILITWPITLLIVLFETKFKVPLIVINVLLFVLYWYMFLKLAFDAMMSV